MAEDTENEYRIGDGATPAALAHAAEHEAGGHVQGSRWFICPLCDDEGDE